MPELPEVQTIVNDLRDLPIFNQPIKKISVYWRRIVNNKSDHFLKNELLGKSITNVSRRGKYIVFTLEADDYIIIHLRMSGRIHIVDSDKKRDKHEHVIFKLSNKLDIRFYNPRKFGRVYINEEAKQQLVKLGAEPLEPTFTLSKLRSLLLGHKRQLKALLLDQHIIAGLGNIYADESLWEAQIHPLRTSASLNTNELKQLLKAIRLVLKRGIKNFGTSLGSGLSNFVSVHQNRGDNQPRLKVYGREGQKCYRCQEIIERIITTQRSTHICTNCQRKKGVTTFS